MSGNHRSKRGVVRIIGGEWRRRQLAVVDGVGLRPTPDRVRETLFNWLQPGLPGARCLDLFAGTGALGFEALSRGASEAVMVERDPRAAAALELAAEELGATGAEVITGDAEAYLSRTGIGGFDLIFVDPPYSEEVDQLFAMLPPLLKPNARIYLERERSDEWPEIAGFEWTRSAAAAGVAFGLAEFRP